MKCRSFKFGERQEISRREAQRIMKLRLKSFLTLALLGAAITLPVLAGNGALSPNTKDLQALKKIMEDQSINYVQTAPKGVILSGYVDTSYSKRLAGSSPSGTQVQAVTNGSLTTEKLTVDMPLPDKNEWAAGFRIDAIHSSATE
jgi:hypothetical protein